MFITNFSLYLHSQNFYLIILTIIGVVLLLSLVSLAFKKELENLVLSFFIFLMFLIILFPALKPNEYKLTIAYVNVNDDNETMTKDVAVNTLLSDGIYPKYNLKYKTEKETFEWVVHYMENLIKKEYGENVTIKFSNDSKYCFCSFYDNLSIVKVFNLSFNNKQVKNIGNIKFDNNFFCGERLWKI